MSGVKCQGVTGNRDRESILARDVLTSEPLGSEAANGGFLNRRGGFITGFFDPLHEAGIQIELFEVHDFLFFRSRA